MSEDCAEDLSSSDSFVVDDEDGAEPSFSDEGSVVSSDSNSSLSSNEQLNYHRILNLRMKQDLEEASPVQEGRILDSKDLVTWYIRAIATKMFYRVGLCRSERVAENDRPEIRTALRRVSDALTSYLNQCSSESNSFVSETKELLTAHPIMTIQQFPKLAHVAEKRCGLCGRSVKRMDARYRYGVTFDTEIELPPLGPENLDEVIDVVLSAYHSSIDKGEDVLCQEKRKQSQCATPTTCGSSGNCEANVLGAHRSTHRRRTVQEPEANSTTNAKRVKKCNTTPHHTTNSTRAVPQRCTAALHHSDGSTVQTKNLFSSDDDDDADVDDCDDAKDASPATTQGSEEDDVVALLPISFATANAITRKRLRFHKHYLMPYWLAGTGHGSTRESQLYIAGKTCRTNIARWHATYHYPLYLALDVCKEMMKARTNHIRLGTVLTEETVIIDVVKMLADNFKLMYDDLGRSAKSTLD